MTDEQLDRLEANARVVIDSGDPGGVLWAHECAALIREVRRLRVVDERCARLCGLLFTSATIAPERAEEANALIREIGRVGRGHSSSMTAV